MSFRVGDEVKTREPRPSGHTRLPSYLAAKRGKVERVSGDFFLPDARAAGVRPAPKETLYTVVFDGAEVWGEKEGRGLLISADLFESYLEDGTSPAPPGRGPHLGEGARLHGHGFAEEGAGGK